jgi:hypothetical protein
MRATPTLRRAVERTQEGRAGVGVSPDAESRHPAHRERIRRRARLETPLALEALGQARRKGHWRLWVECVLGWRPRATALTPLVHETLRTRLLGTGHPACRASQSANGNHASWCRPVCARRRGARHSGARRRIARRRIARRRSTTDQRRPRLHRPEERRPRLDGRGYEGFKASALPPGAARDAVRSPLERRQWPFPFAAPAVECRGDARAKTAPTWPSREPRRGHQSPRRGRQSQGAG